MRVKVPRVTPHTRLQILKICERIPQRIAMHTKAISDTQFRHADSGGVAKAKAHTGDGESVCTHSGARIYIYIVHKLQSVVEKNIVEGRVVTSLRRKWPLSGVQYLMRKTRPPTAPGILI